MKEHNSLMAYKLKWVGKKVRFDSDVGVVDGVGDDGHRCDGDARRRFKPNGLLFVKRLDGKIVEVLDFNCQVIN